MKVCLLGATFETANMGVSALTAGLIESILQCDSDAEIILLDYEKEGIFYNFKTHGSETVVQLVNMRFSKNLFLKNHIGWLILKALLIKIIPGRRLKAKIVAKDPIIQHIWQSNIVGCISGGDSFSDIYGLERFFFVILPLMVILFLKKNLIVLPQTIGPFKGIIAKIIARYVLKNARMIYSRDYEGIEKVKALLHTKNKPRNLKFCHDVGFALSPVAPENLDLEGLNEINKDKSEVVGLNISGLLFMGGYKKNNMFGLKTNYQELIYDFIDFLITQKKSAVLLVPHVFGFGKKNSESDSIVCEMIYHELKPKYQDRLFIVRGSYNQSEIKYIIGLCDFFIGSRMHACIAALSQYIPAVGIAYSKKFKGVFETIEIGHLVADLRIMDKKEIIKVIHNSFEDRKKIKEKLQERIPEIRQEILSLFKEIEIHGRCSH